MGAEKWGGGETALEDWTWGYPLTSLLNLLDKVYAILAELPKALFSVSVGVEDGLL